MFETLGIVLGVIIVLTGAFILLVAKVASKKEYGNDEKQIANAKRNGIISIALGIIAIILFAIMKIF